MFFLQGIVLVIYVYQRTYAHKLYKIMLSSIKHLATQDTSVLACHRDLNLLDRKLRY